MTTLREAVQEYLTMRRSLGFKLREAGKGLLEFATFMEQHTPPRSRSSWRSAGLNDHRAFNRRNGRAD